MESELEKMWASFSLTDAEKNAVVLSIEAMHESTLRGKSCLLSQVIANKIVNREAFKKTMSAAWKPEGWVKFKEVGKNRMLVDFQLEKDKTKVMLGRPWSFDRMLVCLQEFDGTSPLKEILFSSEVFWVQIHNMPWASMTKEVGLQIGQGLGEVLEVEVDSNGMGWGQFMRIKVVVNINLPLSRGRFLSVEGRQIWLPFKYERLPLFCFQCGVIKHGKQGCTWMSGSSQDPAEGESQFGPWLRTNTPKLGGDPQRKYGGAQSHSLNMAGRRSSHPMRWRRKVPAMDGTCRSQL